MLPVHRSIVHLEKIRSQYKYQASILYISSLFIITFSGILLSALIPTTLPL